MDTSPCGHCLIINNMEFDPQSLLTNRRGSNIDCEKLERRFKAFNFVVEVKTNLKRKVRINSSASVCERELKIEGLKFISTFQQIISELSALSKKDHSQFDCCVVIILSHGTEVRPAEL